MSGRPPKHMLDPTELRREYEAGATLRALAAKHGCGHGTIRRSLLKKPGVKRGRPVKFVFDLPTLRCEHEAGASMQQLAAKYGCHKETIRTHLKKAGVKMRTWNRAVAEHGTPEVRLVANAVRRARLAAGVTLPALAEAVGVTYQQFAKYETGRNRISAGRLFTIAQALGLPIEHFYAEFEAVEGKTPMPAVFAQLDDDALRLCNAFALHLLKKEAA